MPVGGIRGCKSGRLRTLRVAPRGPSLLRIRPIAAEQEPKAATRLGDLLEMDRRQVVRSNYFIHCRVGKRGSGKSE